MYPAQALADGIYSASDLPDSVFIDTGEVRQAIRSGTNFIIADGFAAGEDVVLGLNGNVWSQWVEAGSGPEFIIGDYNGACLINFYDVELVGSPIITDNFADTYIIEIDAFGLEPSAVTRQSLCEWLGDDGAFEYRGRINDVNQPYYCKWTASWSESPIAIKQGAQDSPVGTYGPVDFFGVEATITVSEA